MIKTMFYLFPFLCAAGILYLSTRWKSLCEELFEQNHRLLRDKIRLLVHVEALEMENNHLRDKLRGQGEEWKDAP